MEKLKALPLIYSRAWWNTLSDGVISRLTESSNISMVYPMPAGHTMIVYYSDHLIPHDDYKSIVDVYPNVYAMPYCRESCRSSMDQISGRSPLRLSLSLKSASTIKRSTESSFSWSATFDAMSTLRLHFDKREWIRMETLRSDRAHSDFCEQCDYTGYAELRRQKQQPFGGSGLLFSFYYKT